MTVRRWIADEFQGSLAALTGQNAVHLAKVLRVQIGQEFEIITGDAVHKGKVKSIRPDRVEFELGEKIETSPERQVIAYISIFKFDRMEWALEKAVELGVTAIRPMVARRTEVHLAKAAEKRCQRWQTIAKEAARQARRTSIPEVHLPVTISEALGSAASGILLSEVEQQVALTSALQKFHTSQPLCLAFGPEGGWTEDEIVRFTRAGWVSASLGGNILRAETAVLAAMAIAQAWGSICDGPGTRE